jgi:predicted DNA-binding transcriptional regulator YafY
MRFPEACVARRADRLFEIIQILRTARGPVTAAALAESIEVTVRTIYRDIATLQSRRVPIEGAAGIGYLLRRGFDLPPVMFTLEEVDAIALGTRMVKRVRDRRLRQAADSVLSKITSILPDQLRADPAASALYVSDGDTPANAVDLSEVRTAIRHSRKMRIAYVDDRQRYTRRTIWPVALAYYVDATLIGAWCELRRDYRSFRVDRIAAASTLDQGFDNRGGRLTAEWLALPKERAGAPT